MSTPQDNGQQRVRAHCAVCIVITACTHTQRYYGSPQHPVTSRAAPTLCVPNHAR
jgi:hypothetical protein